MPRFHFLFVFPALLLNALAAPARTFHVAPAPHGSDAHEGAAAAPFATPLRAQQAVRAYLSRAEPGEDVIVELAAGTYELTAPLRFEPADSGRPGAAVVWRAAPGAEVVLSGGRAVTGWTADVDSSWRAKVGAGVDFRQLWIDGRRAIRARQPDAGRMFTLAADKQTDGFDLPREMFAAVTVRPREVELSVLIAWMHKRLRIDHLADTSDRQTVRAVIAEPEWDAITRQPQGDRVYRHREFWLENAPEFLDAPGEFHLDRAARVVRYRPRPDEDLARAAVVRPVLENLVVLAGRLDAPVHDLRFEGLTFAHTGWTRPNHAGFVDVQANSLVPANPAGAVDSRYRHDQRKDRVPAAFQAFTADRITVRHCRFARLGGTGVMFTHGGDDNVIEGNSFVDVAGGGIELGEDAARPDNPRLFPRRNRVANNFLTDIGADYFGSVAVLGYYTDGSVITHNEIAAIPYTAISQGWGWGNPPAPDASRAIRITHNLLTNYMRRVDDGGGIYTTDRLPGSEIAHNVLDQMLPPDADTKAGGALYLDQFTEGVHVHDNLVVGAVRWLNIWNPNIRHNRVEANVADTASLRNDGTDNVVEPALLPSDPGWRKAAAALRAAAGLEPAFASVRQFAPDRAVIVDSNGVHFHALAGDWAPVKASGRYAGHARESRDAHAAARWMPVLPASGEYEIGVWRPAGSAATTYVVRHEGGESTATLPAGGGTGQWESLGHFEFAAGAGAEVIVRRTDDQPAAPPLQADAIRFTPRHRP